MAPVNFLANILITQPLMIKMAPQMLVASTFVWKSVVSQMKEKHVSIYLGANKGGYVSVRIKRLPVQDKVELRPMLAYLITRTPTPFEICSARVFSI